MYEIKFVFLINSLAISDLIKFNSLAIINCVISSAHEPFAI